MENLMWMAKKIKKLSRMWKSLHTQTKNCHILDLGRMRGLRCGLKLLREGWKVKRTHDTRRWFVHICAWIHSYAFRWWCQCWNSDRLLALLKGKDFASMTHGPCRTSEDAVRVRLKGGWEDIGHNRVKIWIGKVQWDVISISTRSCQSPGRHPAQRCEGHAAQDYIFNAARSSASIHSCCDFWNLMYFDCNVQKVDIKCVCIS